MDNEEMSTARFVGLCIALGVAAYLSYNAAMVLHVVLVPTWPLWVCWIISGSVTLGLMWFVFTGVGNLFFEGIVCWAINGFILACLAAMIVSAKVGQLERSHQSNLRQQKELSPLDQIDQKIERLRLKAEKNAQQK